MVVALEPARVDGPAAGVPRRGPLDERVFCIRGPSRSGKTSLAERLIVQLIAAGLRVGYIKRTHHALDLPHKSSGRIWQCSPGTMLIHAEDRIQVTVPPGDREIAALVRHFSADEDVLLVETHSPEPHPTILAGNAVPEPGETVIGRWTLSTLDFDAKAAAQAIASRIPEDIQLHRALRKAAEHHGGHACAGLVLGTRLALYGTALLGIEVPDIRKRLITTVEIDRCAADAIQAVTGCRPGRRSLKLLDYGKLAATFVDQWRLRAFRVAVRGDLRELAMDLALPGEERHEAQRRVYLSLAAEDLFTVAEAPADMDQFDQPGPPRRRVRCMACGEEVSDGRDVQTEDGPHCHPCAAFRSKGLQPR